jgi:hypothetical protein|tara:strand:+ start:248 stop:436 length:189 start_codon:yes stop_codon:yes gene_type:complete
MTKFIDTNKKYEVELDIAEAHTIGEALRQYSERKFQDEYISELRMKINTVYERYASEINSNK